MQLQDNFDSIHNNIHSFIEKHGKEGFLKLFFANLLYEMVKDEIHTKSDSYKDSPGIRYYFNEKGEYESTSKLEEFNKKLKNECMKKSDLIVDIAKKNGLISRFGMDLDKINESLASEIEKQIKDIFTEVFKVKWGEEVGR